MYPFGIFTWYKVQIGGTTGLTSTLPASPAIQAAADCLTAKVREPTDNPSCWDIRHPTALLKAKHIGRPHRHIIRKLRRICGGKLCSWSPMSHDSAKCGEEGSVISVRTLSFGFVLVWDPGRNFIYTMGVYGIHVLRTVRFYARVALKCF